MEQIGRIDLFLNDSQDQLTLNVAEYPSGVENWNNPIRLGWGDALEADINYDAAGGKIKIGAVGTLTVRFGKGAPQRLTLLNRIKKAWQILWI